MWKRWLFSRCKLIELQNKVATTFNVRKFWFNKLVLLKRYRETSSDIYCYPDFGNFAVSIPGTIHSQFDITMNQ